MQFLTPDPQNRVNKNLIQNATSDVRCSFCNKKKTINIILVLQNAPDQLPQVY